LKRYPYLDSCDRIGVRIHFQAQAASDEGHVEALSIVSNDDLVFLDIVQKVLQPELFMKNDDERTKKDLPHSVP
jgi:hypothetical protein